MIKLSNSCFESNGASIYDLKLVLHVRAEIIPLTNKVGAHSTILHVNCELYHSTKKPRISDQSADH